MTNTSTTTSEKEAVNLIDEKIVLFNKRNLISNSEVTDFLLDLRFMLAQPEKMN